MPSAACPFSLKVKLNGAEVSARNNVVPGGAAVFFFTGIERRPGRCRRSCRQHWLSVGVVSFVKVPSVRAVIVTVGATVSMVNDTAGELALLPPLSVAMARAL